MAGHDTFPFFVTERFEDAEVFANSNPRFGEPGGEPAVVR